MRRLILLLLVLCLPLGCADEPLTDISLSLPSTIHVSNWGSPLGDGSAKSPVTSLRRAYQLAFQAGADTIRLARGEYPGSEEFQVYGGIHLIGGCDPVTWRHDPNALTRFTQVHDPVLALDIQVPTTIRNLEFQQYQSSFYGEHALAVLVHHCSADLAFIRCRFLARDRSYVYDMASPDTPQDQPDLAPAGLGPVCGEAAPGPGGTDNLYGTGAGGEGGAPGSAGQDGTEGLNIEGQAQGGAGGAPGQDGQNGQDGMDGADGENGKLADPLPLVSGFRLEWPLGQSPSHGYSGSYGGGGGGGGGGLDTGGNGGGSGGRGGQGGHYGQNGPNGGCSVGALIYQSSARFTECHFQAGHASDGSDGVPGTPGAAGAPGGSGGDSCLPDVGRGGDGGHGGHGGSSGGSAGGHGGHSIAIWIVGHNEPTFVEPCTCAIGHAGIGGNGGLHGNGLSRAPAGNDGLALKILRTAGFSSMDPPPSR